jgi:hypothetical protein
MTLSIGTGITLGGGLTMTPAAGYLLVIILLGLPIKSYSQELTESISVNLPCYNTTEIFKSIREKYKELPFMIGQASDEANSLVSIWLNPVDNNWTILATKKDLTCVVGVGTDMKIIPYKKGMDI